MPDGRRSAGRRAGRRSATTRSVGMVASASLLASALQALAWWTGCALALRPSGPPPGGKVLPEADPVIPPGCLAPALQASGGVVVARSSSGNWLDEPSPPLRDANGTYHMYTFR